MIGAMGPLVQIDKKCFESVLKIFGALGALVQIERRIYRACSCQFCCFISSEAEITYKLKKNALNLHEKSLGLLELY